MDTWRSIIERRHLWLSR